MWGRHYGESGWVSIGGSEVMIVVNGKGKYHALSNSGREILQISKESGINAITKEVGNNHAFFNKLEVYA